MPPIDEQAKRLFTEMVEELATLELKSDSRVRAAVVEMLVHMLAEIVTGLTDPDGPIEFEKKHAESLAERIAWILPQASKLTEPSPELLFETIKTMAPEPRAQLGMVMLGCICNACGALVPPDNRHDCPAPPPTWPAWALRRW